MLTRGEDVEVHALHQRGWSISAIARHLERDRKTVRAYVRGERRPGVRRRSTADAIEPFIPYLRARFGDDPHLWLTTLYDEVIRLGYPRSYPTFVRGVRTHALRPHCEPCQGVRGRLTIEIEHPPGEEIQWDWFERRRAPWGGTAYVLLGTLPHSSRVRGVLAPSTDQAHLVEAIDAVLRRLGGTARIWRTDRMATVVVPGSSEVQPSFAPVAKHYGVTVRPCPPRRGNRKGAVEASVRYLCGRWWRGLTATTFGDWDITEHTVQWAGHFPGELTVVTDTGQISWKSHGQAESYHESVPAASVRAGFQDGLAPGYADTHSTDQGSPSQPSDGISLTWTSRYEDNVFIDAELLCVP